MIDPTFRILAKDHCISNNTRLTRINNNDLILGPSGAGKTRGYVKPNLLQDNGSVIIADTKGSLLQEVGGDMAARGYRIVNLDFTDLLGSHGYNPLDYISIDPRTGRYSTQEIMTIAACLSPVETTKDPFWEQSAQMYLSVLIGYVMECLPEEEHSLEYVAKLYQQMESDAFDLLFQELHTECPDSEIFRSYQMLSSNRKVTTTYNCIRMFLNKTLEPLSFDGICQSYRNPNRVDFTALGREKTAVFLTVSDTDRSMDKLVNLFYTQAMHILCTSADKDYPDHRLPVPVRFILDDFATNACIPDFDKLIAVIRSREIYVSIILQSISQLDALYGPDRAMTIVNNCDNCLYLGGQDVKTASYIAVKAHRTTDSILDLPLDQAYLFTRGDKPRRVQKFDLTTHPRYAFLPEANPGRQEPAAPTGRPNAAAGHTAL